MRVFEMIIVCPSCNAKNRVPEEKLQSQPTCGQCHQPLIPLAPIDLNEQNFSNFVSHSDLPILVDLWAEWCGPCKMLSPIIDEIADEIKEAKICKINVDEQPELAVRFNVMTIPTLIIFKEGKEVKRNSGFIPKEEVLEFIKG